jgi:hypothetical protein
MKDIGDILEILIGKYLDGEISPTEQRILDEALQRNSQAKELFGYFQDLHKLTQEAISSEILSRGEDAEEIFERACQQTRHPLRRIAYVRGWPRFAVGLAAGLLIGLVLHFALSNQLAHTSSEAPPSLIAQETGSLPDVRAVREPDLRSLVPETGEDVVRNVDWYSFTDKNGNQWLIEGFRENIDRSAAYYEGL